MKVLFFSTACRDISKKMKKLLSKIYKYVTMILLTFYGGVAQLARASGSYLLCKDQFFNFIKSIFSLFYKGLRRCKLFL